VRTSPLRVLDAGCGRGLHALELDEGSYVVGIDVSQAALDVNTTADEKLLGDVQTLALPAESFDVAVCWDVLEHLPRPYDALDNLVQAIKPGGRLVLGLPHVFSPKALVAKFTPLRSHVWFYKHVFKFFDQTGRPEYGPYKTYMRWNLRPKVIVRYAASRGLQVAEIDQYENEAPILRNSWEKHPIVTKSLTLIWKVVFQGVNPRESELRIVLLKPALTPIERDSSRGLGLASRVPRIAEPSQRED
jgi:SAM-dependent methyltransferase